VKSRFIGYLLNKLAVDRPLGAAPTVPVP